MPDMRVLEQTQAPQNAAPAEEAYAALTERCLVEVLLCHQSSAAKAYIAALVRTAEGLRLSSTNQNVVSLKALAGELCTCVYKLLKPELSADRGQGSLLASTLMLHAIIHLCLRKGYVRVCGNARPAHSRCQGCASTVYKTSATQSRSLQIESVGYLGPARSLLKALQALPRGLQIWHLRQQRSVILNSL